MEATIRLLEKGGHDVVTTNAVAEMAGVSIGTLYQYFASKEAILDALAAREVAALEASVAAVMQTGSMAPQERIAAVVRAVSAGYGRRRQVHRLMMEYSLARGSQRLGPLLEKLIALMATNKRPGANTSFKTLERASLSVTTYHKNNAAYSQCGRSWRFSGRRLAAAISCAPCTLSGPPEP